MKIADVKIVQAERASVLKDAVPQYEWGLILSIWAAAALPMGALGWIVAPAVAHRSAAPVLARLSVLTVGLVWQFVLVVILLVREGCTFEWTDVAARLRLHGPTNPSSGRLDRSLWWWLVPLTFVTALFDLRLKLHVDTFWASVAPALAEPAGWSLAGALGTAGARAELAGAWGTWALFVINALFNTVLGEELLFRGVLLPRMKLACGNRDWVANAVLFGAYHLHQPWGILSSVVHGLLFAFPSRYLDSTWFGIVAHSGQSIYFAILLLGLVLGLAG